MKNLHVIVHGKPILRGVNLELQHGSTHVFDGPQRISGKSTLGWSSLATLATKSPRVSFLSDCRFVGNGGRRSAGERISMAFQRPVSVPGVKMAIAPRDYQRAPPRSQGGGRVDPDAGIPQGN
ncbi:MAG: hypothetical protein R3C56_35810 [Pirellulaceae bacterium]